MLYVKRNQDATPQKSWLTAVKAAQVQSTQLCNCKEYDSALKILQDIGEQVTKLVTEHYFPVAEADKEAQKTLQDNYYSFNFRRTMAQYQIYFMDYETAEANLRELLRDELEFYGMYKKPEVDEADIA